MNVFLMKNLVRLKKLLFGERYAIYEQNKSVYFVVKNPIVEEIKRVLGYGY